MGNANFCWHFGVRKIKIKNYKAVFSLHAPNACQRHCKIHRCQERMVYVVVQNLTITITHTGSADTVRHISLYDLWNKYNFAKYLIHKGASYQTKLRKRH
jgi:1,2-phenylacetyl-CoA epoxidase PaaB subunit